MSLSSFMLAIFAIAVLVSNGVDASKLNNQELKRLLETCGKKTPHAHPIIGAPRDKAPWAVSLQFGSNFCSGTLISPRHIVTARHCIFANQSVIPNFDKAKCKDTHYPAKLDAITIIATTELYVPATAYLFEMCKPPAAKYNDMAVVELAKDVRINEDLSPACILNGNAPILSNLTISEFGVMNATTFIVQDRNGGFGPSRPMNIGSALMTFPTKAEGETFIPIFLKKAGSEKGSSGAGITLEKNGRTSLVGIVLRRKASSMAMAMGPTNRGIICGLFNICFE